jgi:hypothetical protein
LKEYNEIKDTFRNSTGDKEGQVMSQWYYVDREKNDRVGPISIDEMDKLFNEGQLGPNSYVWTKGFENWELIKNIDELKGLGQSAPEESVQDEAEEPQDAGVISQGPSSLQAQKAEQVDWEQLDEFKRHFHIKIGLDRGDGPGSEYGPFSMNELKTLYQENRINQKTLFFSPGEDEWLFLNEIPHFEKFFGSSPTDEGGAERRKNLRKPFVARMFIHDNNELFEGVCRDVSTGGMQVLVGDFPGTVGDEISLNVHPDNGEFGFVASGKIVRKLEGGLGFSFRFTGLSDEAQQAIEKYLSTEETT